ncbi:hypothetical protein, partial [Pseudoalteromonas sp. P1-9]|uniref:hypothetical protein n=1 Tax=Pseudoalteromonas sp. P1-9 TaxID=1710354 RepID=UPI001F3B5920
VKVNIALHGLVVKTRLEFLANTFVFHMQFKRRIVVLTIGTNQALIESALRSFQFSVQLFYSEIPPVLLGAP